jgi:hypothetical protein
MGIVDLKYFLSKFISHSISACISHFYGNVHLNKLFLYFIVSRKKTLKIQDVQVTGIRKFICRIYMNVLIRNLKSKYLNNFVAIYSDIINIMLTSHLHVKPITNQI